MGEKGKTFSFAAIIHNTHKAPFDQIVFFIRFTFEKLYSLIMSYIKARREHWVLLWLKFSN